MLHTSASLFVAFALCACAASHDTSVGRAQTTSAPAPRATCIADDDAMCMTDTDCCSLRCVDARCTRVEP